MGENVHGRHLLRKRGSCPSSLASLVLISTSKTFDDLVYVFSVRSICLRASHKLHIGHDIYDSLRLHEDVERELLLGAPLDDSALVHYLVSCAVLHVLLRRRVVHQLSAELRELPVRRARRQRG